ncbi:NAD(P)-binding domain-containing protein [Luteirhabdus pelagi]|uniref:NAD(P)-binding domain-containing protein n=1 Tax=Luteirhabdus pelagi TaxID=2792783 RepID=UPI00193AD780|nr:NAD(P)-binding domain-containing protein [Luteirhabdus pelagi]
MSEVVLEEIIIYGIVALFCLTIVIFYLRKIKTTSETTRKKVETAKEEGLHEPVSLHPFINLNTCIGSAACVAACPEQDILGIVDGKATVINASNCVGHGACFHACPVEAISLRIGTEKRGVDLPHINENFETNVKGIYIAGELGGMGLIKNSVEQGQQAVQYMVKAKKPKKEGIIDVAIVGAGPAGISATLEAKKQGLKSLTFEQESLGGTVFTFPRSKVVMTNPMELPLHGKVKLYDTSKKELLSLWKKVINEHDLEIREQTKIEQVIPQENKTFKLITNKGEEHFANNVLLSIGRRGSPRKLDVPGEESKKVAYRLLEPERIANEKILVVGGGDSAIEAVLLLKDENEVILSYRKDKFSRLKPKNKEKIKQAAENEEIKIIYSSNCVAINEDSVLLKVEGEEDTRQLKNDRVYIFAGGEMPTNFLQKAGIEITKRFGYILKKHK